MKKIIIGVAALVLATFSAQAQVTITNYIPVTITPTTNYVDVYVTNGVIPSTGITASSGLSLLWNDVKSATNYAIAPYLTYANKAPTKIGGGILAIYNVNNYVGAGMGVDWLGGFRMVNGNIQLKVDTKPLSFIGWTNIVVTPFVLVGIGTPFSNTGGGGVSTIEDVGAYVQFGHFLGGRFLVGAAYGQWTGVGPYSVQRDHGFLGWKKGF